MDPNSFVWGHVQNARGFGTWAAPLPSLARHAGAGVQLCESDRGVQQLKSQRVCHHVCCARLKWKGTKCINKRCQSQHGAHGDGRGVSVDQSWWHLLGWRNFSGDAGEGRRQAGGVVQHQWSLERGRNELVLQGRAAVGLLMLAVLHRITE